VGPCVLFIILASTRVGAAQESALEARFGLEYEGALLGNGLVVHEAKLRASEVTDGAGDRGVRT
jgi:hypothetical protein